MRKNDMLKQFMWIKFTEISSNFWLNERALVRMKISESQLSIWITSMKHWQNIEQKRKDCLDKIRLQDLQDEENKEIRYEVRKYLAWK